MFSLAQMQWNSVEGWLTKKLGGVQPRVVKGIKAGRGLDSKREASTYVVLPISSLKMRAVLEGESYQIRKEGTSETG